MLLSTKLYPSANCNADHLTWLSEEIPEFAEAIAASGQCGYFYANDQLIPYAFIKKLTDAIGFGAITIEYGAVLSPRAMCGEDLWSSFDEQERAAVGPSLLLMIEQGQIALTFPAAESDD